MPPHTCQRQLDNTPQLTLIKRLQCLPDRMCAESLECGSSEALPPDAASSLVARCSARLSIRTSLARTFTAKIYGLQISCLSCASPLHIPICATSSHSNLRLTILVLLTVLCENVKHETLAMMQACQLCFFPTQARSCIIVCGWVIVGGELTKMFFHTLPACSIL